MSENDYPLREPGRSPEGAGTIPQFVFFKTEAGPDEEPYPPASENPNVYYGRIVSNVKFAKDAGDQAITYVETERFDFFCSLKSSYIPEGTLVLCVKQFNRYWTAEAAQGVWGRAIDDWTEFGDVRIRLYTGAGPASGTPTDVVMSCIACAPDGDKGTFGEVGSLLNLTLPRFVPWTCEPTYDCGSAPIYSWDHIDEEWDLDDINGCGGTPVEPPFDGVEGEIACGSCE